MPSFLGPLPYDVKQPYEGLLGELDDTAIKSDCGLVKARGLFKRENNGYFTFDCHLHLKHWRERGSSTKERIHIIVQVQETLIKHSLDKYTLTHSTVRVSYFKLNTENKAQLLHSIHYDYGPAQACHPIFHAQLTKDSIQLTSEIASELEFEFEQLPNTEVFKNARIPTPDMTLPSVLLCLAADHISAEFFPEFLKNVKDFQNKMPQPSFEQTRQSLAAEPAHLRSSHWFAHERC